MQALVWNNDNVQSHVQKKEKRTQGSIKSYEPVENGPQRTEGKEKKEGREKKEKREKKGVRLSSSAQSILSPGPLRHCRCN
jgi:hypothetical protein